MKAPEIIIAVETALLLALGFLIFCPPSFEGPMQNPLYVLKTIKLDAANSSSHGIRFNIQKEIDSIEHANQFSGFNLKVFDSTNEWMVIYNPIERGRVSRYFNSEPRPAYMISSGSDDIILHI